MASRHTAEFSARKVVGTAVKDDTGRKLGQIENVLVDQSGEIVFAVVGFGTVGVVRGRELSHRIPWESLTYQESANAYVVDYSEDELTPAPALAENGVAPRYW